jgi:hypothetical protein
MYQGPEAGMQREMKGRNREEENEHKWHEREDQVRAEI